MKISQFSLKHWVLLCAFGSLMVVLSGCQTWDYDDVPAFKDHDRMIRYCTNEISDNPGDPRYYYYRGLAYCLKHDPAAGLPDFTKSIELDQEHINSYYNRGLCYYNLKQYQEAIQDFHTVLELLKQSFHKNQPMELKTYNMLCCISLREKKYSEALDTVEVGLKLSPTDQALLEIKALAYLGLKDYSKGLEILRAQIVLYPKDQELVLNYALALALCKDRQLVKPDEFKKYTFDYFDHFAHTYHSYLILAKYNQASGNLLEANKNLQEALKAYDPEIYPDLQEEIEQLQKDLQPPNPAN